MLTTMTSPVPIIRSSFFIQSLPCPPQPYKSRLHFCASLADFRQYVDIQSIAYPQGNDQPVFPVLFTFQKPADRNQRV